MLDTLMIINLLQYKQEQRYKQNTITNVCAYVCENIVLLLMEQCYLVMTTLLSLFIKHRQCWNSLLEKRLVLTFRRYNYFQLGEATSLGEGKFRIQTC